MEGHCSPDMTELATTEHAATHKVWLKQAKLA